MSRSNTKDISMSDSFSNITNVRHNVSVSLTAQERSPMEFSLPNSHAATNQRLVTPDNFNTLAPTSYSLTFDVPRPAPPALDPKRFCTDEERRETHEELLDQRAERRLGLQALEALNLQCETQLGRLRASASEPTEAEEAEAMQLIEEVRSRHAEIAALRRAIAVASRTLLLCQLSGALPQPDTAYIEAPDDGPPLCLYCDATPITEIFSCCGHRGACAVCAHAIQQRAQKCPACRTPHPVVRSL